jgi:hypothetical protein
VNDQESDRPAASGPTESLGSAPGPQQSFGSAPSSDGTGTFGSAPPGDQTIGDAPRSGIGKNVPLLVGGGIAIVVILAALFGFIIR